MQGWIKLHRELLDKPIWQCSTPEQKSILITLLIMANHDDNEWIWNGEKYVCKPGQFVTSLESISKKSGTSIQNVRTSLKNFEQIYDFLTNKSTNKNRLITIANWELYQSNIDKPTSRLTSNQQATNKQLTTNKNVKNDKNNIYSVFQSIWKLYPNKKGLGQLRTNKKIEIENIGFEQMERVIKRYIEFVKQKRSTGFDLQYQNGSTFFNSGYIDYLDENYDENDKEEKPVERKFEIIRCPEEFKRANGY